MPVTTDPLKSRCLETGAELNAGLRGLLESFPDLPRGPVKVAGALGVDKVLASRLLKTARVGDPLATLHAAPGPDPLRRVVRAAREGGVPVEVVTRAEESIDAFERLIREAAGDRSALQALLSAWLPEARREFELRRKQSAYRAMSEIHGCAAETTLATVFLHPSAKEGMIDIVWVIGSLGLRRLRPGARIRFASRRVAKLESPRQPMTLDLDRVEDLRGLRLAEFCTLPEAELEVLQAGEVTRYVVAENGFGPNTPIDIVLAEVNFAEIESTLKPGATRSAYFFADVTTPARRLLFDALVHRDVYPGIDPRLLVYDTSFEGVASVNDRSRDLDRLDLDESIRPLGTGVDSFRTGNVPRYANMIERVFDALEWAPDSFRGYRSLIDFPIYGSQVTMSFDPRP